MGTHNNSSRHQAASISRRDFHRRMAAAGTAGFAALTGMGRVSAEESYPPGKYVDMHTHLGQKWGDREALRAKGMLEWMDTHEIAQAVVLPLISPEAWDHVLTPHYVFEETEPYRDRLIPFCSIDPRTLNLSGFEAKVKLLKKYADAGAKGFGEHKPGVAMDDPRNIEVFAAAAEVKLPVLFHLDNNRNWDKPGLPGLEKVLQEVPNGIFIGHAQGWWASIGGGVSQEDLQRYPRGPVEPGGAIDRLMDKYPNIYGDTSAGSGANALTRDPEFGREFLIRRADRIMFGTDYLAPGQNVPQLTLFEEMDLPEDVQAKVYRDNARRVLGL